MIASPIEVFESLHPSADASLLSLARIDVSALNADEAGEVFDKMQDAANKGSAFAMCLCAMWASTDPRVLTPDIERYTWSERAARTGYPPGMFELAQCYEKGIGVQADLGKAQQLYEQSSQGGFAFATFRLGRAYMTGDFGKNDSATAINLTERAYQQGDSTAALYLGGWFESGEKVIQNYSAAASWYKRASDMGNFLATYRLQEAYMLGGLGLPRDPALAKYYETRLMEQTVESSAA